MTDVRCVACAKGGKLDEKAMASDPIGQRGNGVNGRSGRVRER